MIPQTRPRLDEFFLALLWLVGSGVWGSFGLNGYYGNITDSYSFKLPGFVISFFLVCLTLFGLYYTLHVFLRIPSSLPKWVESSVPIVRGVALLLSLAFSLITFCIVLAHLFGGINDNLTQAWGVAAAGGILGLAFYELIAAVHNFEPFIQGRVQSGKASGFLIKRLLWLKSFNLSQSHLSPDMKGSLVDFNGPLLPETDSKTTVVEEKNDGRPGLERIMTAHGGFHVTTLGFTANGSVIFAFSNGGLVHFQAGGRKGTHFPPELKYWDWRNARIRMAALGQPSTFLTHDYQTPPNLHNYRFLVPNGGGRFACVTPRLIKVGEWNSERSFKLAHEEDLVLTGYLNYPAISFNPDGSKLAWCNQEGQARYWDLENDRVQALRTYPAPSFSSENGASVESRGVVFSSDGTKIATLGSQGVLLQNVYTGWRWFAENDPVSERLTAFAFGHNGLEMAVGLSVRAEAGKPQIRRGKGDSGFLNTYTVNFAPNETAKGAPNPDLPYDINSNSGPSTEWYQILRLWDLQSANYYDLEAGSSPLREIAFSLDNRSVAAVDEAGILWLWDIRAESSNTAVPCLIVQLDLGITGRKTVLAFSPDMTYLLTATDNRILLWNLNRIRQKTSI